MSVITVGSKKFPACLHGLAAGEQLSSGLDGLLQIALQVGHAARQLPEGRVQ